MGLQWEKKIIQEYHGKLSFGDLVGRKNWINYFNYAFDPEGKGLLFIGELHLGKKTLIRAAAGEWEEKGYKAYEVYGEDLSKDKKELREQIETIYNEITTGKKILLLYSLDQIKKKEARTTLAFGIEQIMNDAEDAVILATAQSAEILPERLRKFFTICPVRKFGEEELTEVMKSFLAPCWPEKEERQEKLKKYLKDRNCWELERIANLAVNYAVLELTDEQHKTLEEAQELIGEGKVKITTVQIKKAAEDIETVRWKKEPKEYIYSDRFIERPQVREKNAEQPSKDDIIPDEKITGLANLDDQEVQSGLDKTAEILNSKEPTMEEATEILANKGELEELVDLSGMEVVD